MLTIDSEGPIDIIFAPMELDELLDIDKFAFHRHSKTRLSGLVSSSVERNTKSRSRSISRPNRKLMLGSVNDADESEGSISRVSSIQFKKKHLSKFNTKKLAGGLNLV